MSTTRTALARQYRPRRFGEVAMQEHVSATLKTAVLRGRVAHAYLFSGPRGVGKTTAARVLAMALNCDRRGDDGEPCGDCESCERIWAGRTSLDVVEIDAASNRGVDDARDLRERAMYAPTDERRFKVYIIDEAHMLTRDAWNALLKILEEPPPRVIFVFATTEPQKIQQAAPPVLSRCQRFDFRRISVNGIVERLRQVLSGEGIEAGDDVLVPIARRAEGGMRDALSLLDQVLSFAEASPTADDVRRILGLIDDELYLELFAIAADRDHGGVFRFVQRLLDEGYDLSEFSRGLADSLRALLVIRLDGTDALEAGAVRDDLRPAFAELAERFHRGDLLRMLGQVAEFDADGRFRKSANPRLLLEALLLRFAHLDRTVELEDLIRAVEGSSTGPGAASSTGPGGASSTGPGAASSTGPGAASSTGPGGASSTGPGAASSTGPGAASSTGPGGAPSPAPYGAPGATPDGGPAGTPSRVSSADAATASSSVIRGEGSGSGSGAPVPATPPSARGRTPTSRRTPTRGDAPDPTAAAAPDSLPAAAERDVQLAFRAALEPGSGLPPGLGGLLKAGVAAPTESGGVRLELPPGLALEKLTSDAAARRSLETALASRLGRDVDLEVAAFGGGVEERITPEGLKRRHLAQLAEEEPDLQRAVQEFDLELRD